MRRFFNILIILALTLGPWLQQQPAPAQAEPAVPTDTPVALVPAGSVNTFALAAPKLFWNNGVPLCPPADETLAPQATYPETVKRIATYGSTVRTLYSRQVNCSAGEIKSNVVADASYVYWLTPNGLYRTSTDANAADAPQLVNALLHGPGELAMADDKVFAVYDDPFSTNYQAGYVMKSGNHALINLWASASLIYNAQSDGSWGYFQISGSLYRMKPETGAVDLIQSGVSGYYPEGTRGGCSGLICFFTNYVYIGKGVSLYHYNNNTSALGTAIYTSTDPTAIISEVVTDATRAFFVESRVVQCSPQPCFTLSSHVLMRTTRAGASPAPLYTLGPMFGGGINGLKTDGTYLFFTPDDASLQRLANDATALPVYTMNVTGMEVTQGIQNLSNSVFLIKNKRTFVRAYVKSTGAAAPGVTAELSAPDLGLGPLAPINPVGTKITVRPNPDRNDINQSFLFELPWSWTQNATLKLRVTMNPNKVPLEANYLDDIFDTTVGFIDSPSLSVEFFRLNYTLGGKTYKPRKFEDIQQTYSWIMRAYPLGGAIGDKFKPRIWSVDGGTELGKWVNTTDPECKDVYGNPEDDISLCASYFANGWLYYYREATADGDLNVGLNPNAFYYGMISDAAGFFPRGQAMYDKTSVGPAGVPSSTSWDTDGSYADWYAAHEIGHSLGRAHPYAGSDDPATDKVAENCRHSRSDPAYPYGSTSSARAPIGPSNNTMEGFDAGDPTFGIKMAVLPSATWNDVMSYCANQWISDYTYTGMYVYMLLNPSAPQPLRPQVNGDFLLVAGAINTNTSKAGFSLVRRVSSVAAPVTSRQSDYVLRLLDAANLPLGTDQYFDAAAGDTAGILNFGHVLTFLPGTRKVQVVRVADGAVLATRNISANAPTVANVALAVGTPNPASGVVTLNWTANDADGDLLTYDVHYSRDNGVTYQPIATNITTTTSPIDTAVLGGSSTAKLRVIASDGANSGQADSATFSLASKPPEPQIMDPVNNLHIHYGQLVNFNGMALDVQDGTVDAAGLVWKNGAAVLGTGPLLSLDTLPVGSSVITLQATNSKGLSATTSVTVIVDDDLTLPGPTLSAGPGTVGWHVSVGTSTLQTATLSITNTGSGDLTWTAVSDATWLQLDLAGGTVSAAGDPATLTLSANPSGLAGGTSLYAQVTLSGASQTVTIPVTLSVGDIHLPSGFAPSFQTLFIPVIRR